MRARWLAVAGVAVALSAAVLATPVGATTVAPVGEVYVANSASGTISQFGVDKHGVLSPLPVPAVTVAGAPTHLLLNRSGKYLYALDCAAGELDQFSVAGRGTGKGGLVPLAVPAVPVGPCVEDPATGAERVLAETHSGKFLFVLELSATGAIAVHEYSVGKGGLLTSAFVLPTAVQNYASLVITPNGKFVYVLAGSGEVSVMNVSTDGALSEVAAAHPSFACPTDGLVTPNGKTMYVAEQCNGTLTTMHVEADGSLTLLGINRHGCPRELAVTPDNKNLYVADACAGVIFQYRAFTGGVLTEQIPFSVPSGTVLAMEPAHDNKALYVTIDNGTQNLAAYPVAKSGLLGAPVPYGTGAGTWGIAVRR